jgi:hypothetical protein
MDSTAFGELIAEIRNTATAVAEAERKVAAFRAALTQPDRGPPHIGEPRHAPALHAPRPRAPKRGGWLPATDSPNR